MSKDSSLDICATNTRYPGTYTEITGSHQISLSKLSLPFLKMVDRRPALILSSLTLYYQNLASKSTKKR